MEVQHGVEDWVANSFWIRSRCKCCSNDGWNDFERGSFSTHDSATTIIGDAAKGRGTMIQFWQKSGVVAECYCHSDGQSRIGHWMPLTFWSVVGPSASTKMSLRSFSRSILWGLGVGKGGVVIESSISFAAISVFLQCVLGLVWDSLGNFVLVFVGILQCC